MEPAASPTVSNRLTRSSLVNRRRSVTAGRPGFGDSRTVGRPHQGGIRGLEPPHDAYRGRGRCERRTATGERRSTSPSSCTSPLIEIGGWAMKRGSCRGAATSPRARGTDDRGRRRRPRRSRMRSDRLARGAARASPNTPSSPKGRSSEGIWRCEPRRMRAGASSAPTSDSRHSRSDPRVTRSVVDEPSAVGGLEARIDVPARVAGVDLAREPDDEQAQVRARRPIVGIEELPDRVEQSGERWRLAAAVRRARARAPPARANSSGRSGRCGAARPRLRGTGRRRLGETPSADARTPLRRSDRARPHSARAQS